MKNLIKAIWFIHGRMIEVVLMVVLLPLAGAFGGYLAAEEKFAGYLVQIKAQHVEEIARLQVTHERAIRALTDKVEGVAEQQASTVDKVQNAATTAQRAAVTAQGAAQNAARATIRERKP